MGLVGFNLIFTGSAIAGVEEIGGAVGVGETDAGGSFKKQEVGD